MPRGHHGDVANYLYADGHVAPSAAEPISQWCDQAFAVAHPPD
jgi:prepilin-type processing-associated H-X9-DG protein